MFQGDKEAELGLAFSPLCDRKSTMVPQSQIGEYSLCVHSSFQHDTAEIRIMYLFFFNP